MEGCESCERSSTGVLSWLEPKFVFRSSMTNKSHLQVESIAYCVSIPYPLSSPIYFDIKQYYRFPK
ncbi:hypothetical protein P5673_012618 [Acropora cervicornis]|uniref:Uncharacterized protein n=1 Tax=Acropora cervicornis TaxID=6130 RepID=A0AAD9QLV1_ACRCE|nr:hypothetical protein P5673_012618 [Acropora cervicornis]